MKKRLIVCGMLPGLLVMMISRAEAVQVTSRGFKGGLSLANITGGNKDRLGFVGGGYVNINIRPGFSIQPELLIVQKGSKYTEYIMATNIDHKEVIRLTYLEIPILAKYSFVTGPKAKVSVFGGPAFAFDCLATRYEWWKNCNTGEEKAYTYDYNVRVLDIGLAFGGGVDLSLGKFVLTFDIRYTLGLSGLYLSSERYESPDRNSAIMLLVGLGN